MASKIRIGVIGAGENARVRHIPEFRRLREVEIVAVANRSRESGQNVANALGIPRVHSDWRDLLADPLVDAVLIGTWPYLHCEATCAALTAGKHVLVEARMARNLSEAEQMLAAARAHPHLVTQIVPSPLGLQCGPAVQRLLDDGALGELRELAVIGANDSLWDDRQPVHWRQDSSLSGRNVLMLGILHETVLRWCPPPDRVFAQAARWSQRQPAPGGVAQRADLPDVLHVLTRIAGGGRGLYHLSGMALFGPATQIHLYGSHGTIRVEFGATERVCCGRAGQTALRELAIPPEERGGWRVEAEFVGAIRGEERVRLTDFETGVRYMAFTDAVLRSVELDLPVDAATAGQPAAPARGT